jgi:hypothetical protein
VDLQKKKKVFGNFNCMDSTVSGCGPKVGSCEYDNKYSNYVKSGKINQIINFQLLSKNCAIRSFLRLVVVNDERV